jgi:meiotically up-regulated gene 157 (Mug157) protein
MHADLVGTVARRVEDRMGSEVGAVFANCFANTLSTTMTAMPDGTTFMVTGDIPAMWLRDSTAQLTPYLHFVAEDTALADTVASVSRRQLEYVLVDPYANAFNRAPDGAGHADDLTATNPWVWERKYEIDSLCYPIRLAYDLWERTGRTDHLGRFAEVATVAVDLWTVEQDHDAASPYRFERPDPLLPSDTLVRDGRGPATVRTGLTWSAFRPSDDATTLGYNIPGNAFAVTELRHIAVLAAAVLSPTNPYWFQGATGSGIGSPHTPGRNVWPIALAVQGLTATDPDERAGLLRQLCATHGGTQLMHESFDVDDPTVSTRPWFSWANAMFCEFVLDLAGLRTTPAPAAVSASGSGRSAR